MQVPKYKFYVNSIEVHPLYSKLSKKYEKESGEYFFREKVEGPIKLVGQDFMLIESASIEQDLIFTIYKQDSLDNTFKPYYTSKFNKTDCTFNYDTKACTIKLKENDRYTGFMDKYENTIDLLKYGVRPTPVGIAKRGVIQVYLVNSSVLTNLLGGGTYWEQDCESIGNPEDLIHKYYFSQSCAIHGINFSELVSKPSYMAVGRYTYSEYQWANGNIAYELSYYSPEDRDWYLKLRVLAKTGEILGKEWTGDVKLGIFSRSSDEQLYGIIEVSDDLPEDKKGKYVNMATLQSVSGNDRLRIYALPIEHVYSRLLCDMPVINGITTYKIPSEDIVENTGNYRYVVGYDFEEIAGSNRFTSEVTPYGNNSKGRFYLPPSSIYGQKFFPINRSMWYDEYSVWFGFSPMYNVVEESMRKAYTLRDGYYIADVIKTMLAQTAPGITHEATEEYSEFLYSESCPLGLAKFYLFITPKSNILKGEYDQAAQKGELTFKGLMEMLWRCFKLRWFIDDENRLRIEHISWFLNGGSYGSSSRNVQIDLTENRDYKNLKALSRFQNEITYDKSELAGRFEFSWADSCTQVFEGTPINVISKYVEASKVESVSASKFTPDVDYMLAEPSNFSQDGFALLCAIKGPDGKYELPFVTFDLKDQEGLAYSVVVQNGYASWLYLVKYYMYDMPGASLKYDYLADYSLQVEAIKRSMQQKIEFPREEDPDTIGLVKTERGEGVIESMTVDMVNRQVNATLSFSPK